MENHGNYSDTAMELPGEMSERARYFTEKFDALMEKYDFKTDQNAILLRNQVVAWLNSSGDLVVPGFVTGLQAGIEQFFGNKILKKEVNQLLSEVAELKTENKNLNGRIASLEAEREESKARLASLEAERDARDLRVVISDLGRMYATYVVVPLLPSCLGLNAGKETWKRFCETYRDKEADVDDGVISRDDFQLWLQPLSEKLTVDVELLMDAIKQRNLDSHTDIRSATKQQAFIQRVTSINVEGEQGTLIKSMVASRSGATFKRMN